MKRNPKQLIGLIGLICCIVLIMVIRMRTDAPADSVVDLQSVVTSSSSSSGQKDDSETTQGSSSQTASSQEDDETLQSSGNAGNSYETSQSSGTAEDDYETPQSSGTTEDFGNFLPAPELTWLTQLDIPAWSGKPYVEQNGNVPFFDTDSIKPEPYEIYYDLDSLGRCTLADAVAGPETQPREKRGNIGSVHPTGWHKDRYSFVEGEALYNRCHLIAYYLTAENANPRNLVTGTSYMNRQGMNDFENLVGDYIKETGNHVRYRVTPVWTGDNLICDGLLVEGWSIEDEGDGICFCIYAYNVEPGIHIDYQTGDNYAEEGYDGSESAGGYSGGYSSNGQTASGQQNGSGSGKDSLLTEEDITGTYVLNRKSKKFHYPDCEGAIAMSEKNREEYTGSRNALIIDGYTPCPECQP